MRRRVLGFVFSWIFDGFSFGNHHHWIQGISVESLFQIFFVFLKRLANWLYKTPFIDHQVFIHRIFCPPAKETNSHIHYTLRNVRAKFLRVDFFSGPKMHGNHIPNSLRNCVNSIICRIWKGWNLPNLWKSFQHGVDRFLDFFQVKIL